MNQYKPYTPEFLVQLLADYEKCGRNQSELARQRGLARCTVQSQLLAAFRHRDESQKVSRLETQDSKLWPVFKAEPAVIEPVPKRPEQGLLPLPATEAMLDAEAELRAVRAELAGLKKDSVTQEYIRRKLFKLAETPAIPPRWTVDSEGVSRHSPGVPTVFASDWHWAEVIDPSQVGGVNEYDLHIAHTRARKLISSTINLLKNHIANPEYPGIVFALGGDMISGDIHEELVANNEVDIMPAVVDIFGVLIWCIETLAEHFGRVFVPGVSGNHGRNTHKIRAKGRNFTSFDWLIMQFLERHFLGDNRVAFYIPNASDALYRIFDHRYLLTHGDQFRGGDGLIGMLGPVIRGDHRKRGRQSQINAPYDTMLMGHYHTYSPLGRVIVNGSLCGYNEYAWTNNFGFEPPQQALWLTHPRYGRTWALPVNVGEVERVPQSEWVSWAA